MTFIEARPMLKNQTGEILAGGQRRESYWCSGLQPSQEQFGRNKLGNLIGKAQINCWLVPWGRGGEIQWWSHPGSLLGREIVDQIAD